MARWIEHRRLSVCLSIGGLLLITPLVSFAAEHARKLPERFVVPYVDMARQPNDLAAIARDAGLRYFTLAFVNAGDGCRPAWFGAQPVAGERDIVDNVARLRQHGGDIILAFGGYEGTELAMACSDPVVLAAAYQQMIDRYKPLALDFDIEHLAIDDAASLERRSQALRRLADANPGLHIFFTLPATPDGLTAKSMAVLASAKAHGVPIELVNLMTMDYGQTATSKEMGENAIAAAKAAIVQLQQQGVQSRIGITPMLGVNDVAGETFTLADATALVGFAAQSGLIRELSYWSAARDNGSCRGTVLPTCSGLEQRDWQFAGIFAAFGSRK